jgi:hypothetical protein
VGFFEAVVEKQHLSPVFGTFTPGFRLPGKFCELATRSSSSCAALPLQTSKHSRQSFTTVGLVQ